MRTQLQNDKSVFHGFNLISWGLLANVEFESIPLRKLGSLRYFVYVMKHLVLKKKFRGEIWINLVPRSQVSNFFVELVIFQIELVILHQVSCQMILCRLTNYHETFYMVQFRTFLHNRKIFDKTSSNLD